MVHVFCECNKVKPIWSELCSMLDNKLYADYQFDNFEFMFGDANDMLLSFLFLCCKYYIYR